MPEPLRDRLDPPAGALQRARRSPGRVWDVRSEHVDLGEGGVVVRDFVDHTGAVAVLALDDEDRVVLVQQYRHPVGAFEWELPAGLLDVDGEPAHLTAARELHEEADLVAGEWHLLLDHYASPGGSSEALRVFLARDLTDVPDHERHEREGEELGMPVRRVPLDELARGRARRRPAQRDPHGLGARGIPAARARVGGAAVRATSRGRRALPVADEPLRRSVLAGCRWRSAVCPCGGVPQWRLARVPAADPCSTGSALAATAEALMRSRYTAYALGDGDHLFRTWHARTRPDDVEPDPRVRWVGLDRPRRRRRRAGRRRGRRGVPGRSGSATTTGRCAGARCTSAAGSCGAAGRWVYLDAE